MSTDDRGATMAKPKTKKAQLARLRARLEVLTGKGTEQMRASLQAQIDALESPPKVKPS